MNSILAPWPLNAGPRFVREQPDLQQHLVEFQGRTLCITCSPRISCVLEAVFAALKVPQLVVENLETPWRIMCGGKFLAAEDTAPSQSMLRVWTGGLRGGKGGFGAMLRAMAKQASTPFENGFNCNSR